MQLDYDCCYTLEIYFISTLKPEANYESRTVSNFTLDKYIKLVNVPKYSDYIKIEYHNQKINMKNWLKN